jgi:hypothetical protein
MMIAVALVGLAIWAYTRYQPGWKYYLAGWRDAERELQHGEATIYALGGLIIGDVCNIDEDTGLPIQRVCGCVILEGDIERVKGHNDRIEQYISRHGLPRNTLKPWQDDLRNLKRCFDDRSRAVAPKRLHAGGPKVVLPDGRNSIRPTAGVKDDGSPSDSLKIIIAEGNVVLGDWYVRFGEGDSDVDWGPEGSRFTVIRSISGKSESYEAYDLRTGRCLRTESWYDKRRPRRDERIPVQRQEPPNQDQPPNLDVSTDAGGRERKG